MKYRDHRHAGTGRVPPAVPQVAFPPGLVERCVSTVDAHLRETVRERLGAAAPYRAAFYASLLKVQGVPIRIVQECDLRLGSCPRCGWQGRIAVYGWPNHRERCAVCNTRNWFHFRLEDGRWVDPQCIDLPDREVMMTYLKLRFKSFYVQNNRENLIAGELWLATHGDPPLPKGGSQRQFVEGAMKLLYKGGLLPAKTRKLWHLLTRGNWGYPGLPPFPIVSETGASGGEVAGPLLRKPSEGVSGPDSLDKEEHQDEDTDGAKNHP